MLTTIKKLDSLLLTKETVISARKAMEAYLSKHAKETRQQQRGHKRKNPEKLVQAEIIKWARDNKFDLTVVDSGFRRYEDRKTSETGVSDLVGNTPEGQACFIELKAPYQKQRPSNSQYLFLKRKIESGCFACVTDSVDHINTLWSRYKATTTGSDDRKILLLNELKKPKNIGTMDDDLDFSVE